MKILTLFLAAALLLSGCAAGAQQPAELQNATTAGKATTAAATTVPPTGTTTVATTMAPTVAPTVASTMASAVAPTTVPAATVAPTVAPTAAPTIVPTVAPTVAPTTVAPTTVTPTTVTPTTVTPTTAAPTAVVPTTAASVRPVSSATCKDTGSQEIWQGHMASVADDYRENDPERKNYLAYLEWTGNHLLFWMQEDNLQLYLGYNYGIPLYTTLKIMLECTWESSDPSVATVNQRGFVTPLKEGETTVTVTHVDPQTQETTIRSCYIRVVTEPVYTYAQLEQMAHEKAKKYAEYALNYPGVTTDLERIGIAASLVHSCLKVRHGSSITQIVNGQLVTTMVPGYNRPFGTMITHYSSCAGDTRAMGLVLEYMGFEWYHVNADQWDHQWCVVYDVDGQTAYADPSNLGLVGYGEGASLENRFVFQNGQLVPT